MRIKVTEKILNYDNKPLQMANLDNPLLDENGKPRYDEQGNQLYHLKDADWRFIFHRALNSFLQTENPVAEEKKQKAYQVTTKLYSSDEPDFTPTEIAYILERVKKIETPLVMGRTEELFKETVPEVVEEAKTEVKEEIGSIGK